MIEQDKDGYLVIYPNEDTNVVAGRSRGITSDTILEGKGIIIPVSPFGRVCRVVAGEPVTIEITNTGTKHIPIRTDQPMCHVMMALDSAKATPISKPAVVKAPVLKKATAPIKEKK